MQFTSIKLSHFRVFFSLVCTKNFVGFIIGFPYQFKLNLYHVNKEEEKNMTKRVNGLELLGSIQEGMRYLKIGQAVKGFVDFVGKTIDNDDCNVK